MELTKNQIKAVKDKSKFLAITAGAGSGKTSVLIERIDHILTNKLAKLDEILAITFTEKAASELKERLLKKIDDDLAVISAYIGTFHSFCAKILREHAPIIDIDPDFAIVEEYTAGILRRKAVKSTLLWLLKNQDKDAERMVDELDFKNSVALLEELLEYRWHAEQISNVKFQMSKEGQRANDKREDELRASVFKCFKKVADKYDAEKGIDLDFQDLEIFAIKLLENSEIRKRYQKRFKYILVDEFQDINDTQAKLISLLHNKDGGSLTIVGDQKQSIYRFRGANVHQFEKAIKDSKNTVELSENFRSTPKIITFVNETFPEFAPLVADSKDNTESITILNLNTTEEDNIETRRKAEATAIADIIPNLKGKTALLFYSLSNYQIYSRAFAERGILHLVHGGKGFLEKEEILDILNALRIANDPNDIIALLGLARSEYIGLTDDELYLLTNGCGKDQTKLYEAISNDPKGSILKKLEKDILHLGISEIIRSIAGDKINDNIEKLCHMALASEEREKITLKDFIDYLMELRDKNGRIGEFPSSDSDSVLLMTIHQSKGLEFDNVVVADLSRQMNYEGGQWCFVRGEDGGIAFKLRPEDNPDAESVETPYYEELSAKDKTEDAAEKNRLLYVAMTRAKKNLILPLHPNANRTGAWHKHLLEITKK